MECKAASNKSKCNCTYPGCPRKGICCECLQHHLGSGVLPACCFPKDVERTYDRSVQRFVECMQR
ncbi:MAG: cytosolic protein [Euryarchaeota archaeon]|nr:cytosolic protein [Euryarchaeota archaeon]